MGEKYNFQKRKVGISFSDHIDHWTYIYVKKTPMTKIGHATAVKT
jgi:hypothetical protein